MTRTDANHIHTEIDLAHLGEGSVAYLREMDGEELNVKFPNLPHIEPAARLWALFAANGQPILLSDARDRAIAGAFENDLMPVSVH